MAAQKGDAPRLTPTHLLYVSEAARLGSIAAASSALRISQSSILAAVDRAEALLKARIFDRKPARGVRLTPAGARLVAAAQSLLAAEAEFQRSIGGIGHADPSVLRIGCFEPFGALFMAEFLKTGLPPNDRTRIVMMEGSQPELRGWLADGTVEAVVTYDIGPRFGESITRICSVPPHALLHVDDPLSSRTQVRIADLARRPLVLLDLPETATYLLTLFEAFASRPRVGLHTRSYETVRAAVGAGHGAAVLNMKPVGGATPDGPALVRRPLVEALPSPVLIVADRYEHAKPAYLARLIEALKKFFAVRNPADFAVASPARLKQLFVEMKAN